MMRNVEERIRYANVELCEKGNFDVVEELFSVDYVAHAEDKQYHGHRFIKEFVGLLRTAIPDLEVVEIKMLIQADDKIAWQRTLRGTHMEDMMGIPPSNRKVEWRDMMVTRFQGEKIAEEWTVSDLAGQLLLKLK